MRSWIILFLWHHISSQIINNTQREITEALSNCLSLLTTAADTGNQKLEVWYSKDNEDLLLEFLGKVQAPVVLNAAEPFQSEGIDFRVFNNIIIILNNVTVRYVLENTLWNSRTRFLVVNRTMEELIDSFQQFWEFKVVNVFGMLKEGDDILVYSFVPYGKEHCNSAETILVEKYITSEENFLYKGTTFKDPVRIKNMYGCRVNITIVNVKPNIIFKDECGCNATTHIGGIEGLLMTEIARRFNFNATFVIALDGIGWGWVRPSPHGAAGEVYTGRSDFAVGLLGPTMDRVETLDLSIPYSGEECVTFGLPAGARASTPNWITILTFEFSVVTWVLIFFTFTIIFVVLRVFNKVSNEVWLPTKVDTVLTLFSSCIGLPVKVPNNLSLKISILFWFVFTFILMVGYRSSMGSKLTVPSKDLDINTFQELLDSKLELTGYNNMFRLLQYHDDEPLVEKMMNKFKVTDFDIDYAVDRIAAERKMAHVRHTTTFLYYSIIDAKARGHIHVIKDCVLVYYPIVLAKRHSPFTLRINQLISRLRESGLTKKWRAEYIYDVPPPPKPFLKLSMSHMYGVFCILCFGYLMGSFVFVIELVNFYLVKEKNVII